MRKGKGMSKCGQEGLFFMLEHVCSVLLRQGTSSGYLPLLGYGSHWDLKKILISKYLINQVLRLLMFVIFKQVQN